MSVIPGSRSSPGFCHIRRQGNRSAQKQIICPIYRGWPFPKALQDGSGTEIFDRGPPLQTPPRTELIITLLWIRQWWFRQEIQRVNPSASAHSAQSTAAESETG